MKISTEFKTKLSKISIFFANIFQIYIIFTIGDMIDNGMNESNLIMLVFNIFYIIALYFYNSKTDAIFELRGKFLSVDYNEKMTEKEKNTEIKKICKKLFYDILDGDFRP